MRKSDEQRESATDTSSDTIANANFRPGDPLQENSHSLVRTCLENRRDKLMPDSRRNHYRVIYPFAERPSFSIGWASFEIVECSERGLRYELGERRWPKVGEEVAGRVTFRSGETVDVIGDVVRVQDGFTALALRPPGIPYAVVIHEQRYLRGKGFRVTD